MNTNSHVLYTHIVRYISFSHPKEVMANFFNVILTLVALLVRVVMVVLSSPPFYCTFLDEYFTYFLMDFFPSFQFAFSHIKKKCTLRVYLHCKCSPSKWLLYLLFFASNPCSNSPFRAIHLTVMLTWCCILFTTNKLNSS